jgi:multidrug efflux pump subunit AcrA (membrane-fusion protein)
LQYLISRTVYNSELGLDAAMADLEEKKAANASSEQISAAEEAVSLAQKALISAQYYYKNEYIPSVLKYTPSSEEISLARAQLRTSELALEDANLYIERLSSDEPCEDSATVGSFTSLLNQACLDIDLARLALDGTELTAPFDGLVTAVDLAVGQVVTSSPVISMATSEKFVQFFVEEADLDGIQTGLPVNIIFDAYPEEIFHGVLERIDPELEVIDGTPAISIWASVDLSDTDKVLLSGLTAEVEIVIGEANGTVLIPTQALRELAPGSYAVFVIQPDQSMKLTPVTIGLRDIANIQVLSGLKAGDIVSTGIVETK